MTQLVMVCLLLNMSKLLIVNNNFVVKFYLRHFARSLDDGCTCLTVTVVMFLPYETIYHNNLAHENLGTYENGVLITFASRYLRNNRKGSCAV